MIRMDAMLSLSCALLLCGAAACGAEQPGPVTAQAQTGVPPPLPAAPPARGETPRLGSTMQQAPSDGDASPAALVAGMDAGALAGAAVEINDRTIRLAQLGESKASRQVKRLAHDMETAHLAMQGRLKAALTHMGITPSDSAASAKLKSDAGRELTTLTSVTGADFDRYYLDAQVRIQSGALETLDRSLEQVMTPELKQELQEMRDKVAAHLRMATAEQKERAEGTPPR
jgi:putative membrane protein